MYLNKITVSLLSTIFLLLMACNEDEFLDRYPKASPSPSSFFVNAESARMAVNACTSPWQFDSYTMFRRDMVMLLDGLSDDSFVTPNRSNQVALEMWNVSPTHENVVGWWRYPYQSINAANFAIDNIPKSLDPNFTPEKQAAYIAEAKFYRAYSYLFLTFFYGDVPLLTSAASSFEEFNTPRTPKAQVLAQVVEDFTYAKDNLPAKQTLQGPPNKAAGAAFLAKTYLVLKDWPKAETAAREAIQIAEANGHKLLDDYMAVHTQEGNPELLFYWSYAENLLGYGNDATVQRLCRNLPAPLKVGVWGDGWGCDLPQRDLFDAFEEGDPRRGYTLYYPDQDFGIYNGTTNYTCNHEKYDETGKIVKWQTTYKPGDMVKYDHTWSPTGLNVRKRITSMKGLVAVGQCGLDIPVMRMGELYLILAEALAEQGKPEALNWVNKVRARASVNMPPKTAADGSLVDLVRHERRVELALEGLRLFDLIRWGTIKNAFGDGTKVKRHFYSDYMPASSNMKFDKPIGNLTLDALFPLPQYEIDNNSEININNPGW